MPSRRNFGTWSVASFRLAVPNVVTRIDSPRDPPTCWEALRVPEAAPASFGAIPETAIRVSDTNCMPIPKPNTSIGPRIEPR